ncbi:MAG: hypothetical protein H0X45_05825 [Planctomycetes bacterium]|nr:hypothetical protein [Planctomycetota bacterium]
MAITEKTKRGLYVLALVSEHLPGDLKPVVVGGFAVEFYAMGGYNTNDVDVLYLHPSKAGELLAALGFTKVNRHWICAAYGLQIEFPGHVIEARARERITTLTIDGRTVSLIGIEDLILDRLNIVVHGKSPGDRRWPMELVLLHRDDLDMDYLQTQAQADRTAEELAGILREIAS